MENNEVFGEEQQTNIRNKKIFFSAIFVVLAIVLVVGYFLKNSNPNDIDLENTLEYTYYDSSAPFTFRYPKELCITQDIGTVVVHDDKSPCGGNNAVNVKDNYLIISVFPAIPNIETNEKITTTEEYAKSRLPEGTKIIGKTKNIGGYEALEIVSEVEDGYSFIFLTEYKLNVAELFKDVSEEIKNSVEFKKQFGGLDDAYYGMAITPNFDKTPEGENAEKIILSTLKFPTK